MGSFARGGAGSGGNRRPGRVVVAVVVAALVGTGTLVTAVAPAGAGTLDITVDPNPPVANAPLTFTVNASGCPASTFVLIYLTRLNADGDMLQEVFMDEAFVETDADGEVTATFDEPFAYPGRWGATSQDCGAFDATVPITVDPPAAQVAAVTPGSFTAGDTVTVSGGACFGERVEYAIVSRTGPPPLGRVTQGSAVPGADGTWTGTLVTDVTLPGGPAQLQATCIYEPTILVNYDVVPVSVEAAVVTLPTAVPNPPPTPPVVVTPTFTG